MDMNILLQRQNHISLVKPVFSITLPKFPRTVTESPKMTEKPPRWPAIMDFLSIFATKFLSFFSYQNQEKLILESKKREEIYHRRMLAALEIAAGYLSELQNEREARRIVDEQNHKLVSSLEQQIIILTQESTESTYQIEYHHSHYVTCLEDDWTAELEGEQESEEESEEDDYDTFEECCRDRIFQAITSWSSPQSIVMILDDLEMKFDFVSEMVLLKGLIVSLAKYIQCCWDNPLEKEGILIGHPVENILKKYRVVVDRYVSCSNDRLLIIKHSCETINPSLLGRFLSSLKVCGIIDKEDLEEWSRNDPRIPQLVEKWHDCNDDVESGYESGRDSGFEDGIFEESVACSVECLTEKKVSFSNLN